MELPYSEDLEINCLTSVFEEVTNSYKYYWFLAILNSLKVEDRNELPVAELVYEMVADVWYAVNYFKLSFGTQDKLTEKIGRLMVAHPISSSIHKADLLSWMHRNSEDRTLREIVLDLSRYVPYRFLSPWFSNELRGKPDSKKNKLIVRYANESSSSSKPAPYLFTAGTIQLNSRWKAYMQRHLGILLGYTKWKLLQYLQKNNPYVPGITEKLSPPVERNLKLAKQFWKICAETSGPLHCLYTHEPLNPAAISIDHFIPWSFVAHDQLWNLLPVSKSVNSAKGNRLPDEKYLQHLCDLQYTAFHQVHAFPRKHALLEDYCMLFKDNLDGISNYAPTLFHSKLTDNLQPAFQIARNMGFVGGWSGSR